MSNKRFYRSELRTKSKLQTQKDIVSSALKMHGIGVTALEAIAEDAGVCVATVRKYFPTREALFAACTTHFLKTYPLPSLGAIANLPHGEERLTELVRQIYALHEASFGQTWMAYKLEDESEVMAETRAQADTFIESAVRILFSKWQGKEGQKQVSFGYVKGLLSPLSYRAFRLFGQLDFEQCVRQTTQQIALLLGIDLTEGRFGPELSAEEPDRQSERMIEMNKVNLNEVPLLDSWHENIPEAKWKVNMPFTPAFPAWSGIETETLSAVFFELEEGHLLGEHTDSAEELVYVIEGTVEVAIGSQKDVLTAGSLFIIPAMEPHQIKNVGSGKAKCLGFFSNTHVVSTFNETVEPIGSKSFG